MSKRINKGYIDIDGAKLKSLLESATGKTLREISLENGFSDSFLRMVIKKGKATPAAQSVIRRYGIEPSAYELVKIDTSAKATEEKAKQLTLDDLVTEDAKAVIKDVVREAVFEFFYNCEFRLENNPIDQTIKLHLRYKEA